MSQQMGFRAEEYARDYLTQQGLVWRASNYRCRLGEIDLIMQDGVYLVFVEVRSRRSSSHGNALESITFSKQQKLIKTANLYLLSNKLHEKYPTRFDVISLQGQPPEVSWIKNAFGC
ncbi:MAG: YraN family protein [Legionellaceae bacterium]|nr:YraN family protein [Legionellaceae bacterium]